jgi:hypothetical protein
MSGNGTQHPARSVEFLSRLHDGDLDPSERARFEAHRAHCAECRRAALEFEDAISLFRTSRSRPPRADLAARILRKVQSTNRPRAPFSPRFRIDLAWAALLATGLLALLITTPIAVRRTSPPALPAAPPEAAAPDRSTISPARQLEPEVATPDRAPASGRIAAGPAPLLRKQERREREVAEKPESGEKETKAAEQVGAARASEADGRNDQAAPRVVVSAESPALAAGGSEEPPASTARAVPLRLTFHSIDGYGSAPPLLSDDVIELSPQERGREYVLLLDSQGVVREVRPSSAPAVLSRLHFRPGSRPRRLIVRVE